MKRDAIDILICYGPMLMMGLIAPYYPDVPFINFVIVGVVWIFLWRLYVRKRIAFFNPHPDGDHR